jgi:hypothetical protein
VKRVAFATGLTIALAVSAAACGLRTPVRPPEATAPVIPGTVEASREGGLVVVRWKRADHSADGRKLEDLAAFVVERRRGDNDLWQRIATVDVVDQEKIRRRRDFSYRDAEAGDGAASYRVIAVCADGQEGPPTTAVQATPEATPAATAAPI